MKINEVVQRMTITGVDVKTDLDAVGELLAKTPGLEIAMLYSQQRGGVEGQNRYSPKAWLMSAAEKLGKKGNVAVHLCGRDTVQDFVAGRNGVRELVEKFGRVQFNGNMVQDELGKRLERVMMENYWRMPFITQHNETNAAMLTDIKWKEHAVLIDDSGGQGILPPVKAPAEDKVRIMCPNVTCRKVLALPQNARGKTVRCQNCHTNIRVPGTPRTIRTSGRWERLETDKAVGYSGGLGPGVLEKELMDIAKVAKPGSWIDMEGKVRTNDWFDINKARPTVEDFERVGQMEIV